jgi:hypothetical protein
LSFTAFRVVCNTPMGVNERACRSFRAKTWPFGGFGRKTIKLNYLNKLYCNRGFADTTGTDDDEFVRLDSTAVLGHCSRGSEELAELLKKNKKLWRRGKCKLFLRDISWRLSRLWCGEGLD